MDKSKEDINYWPDAAKACKKFGEKHNLNNAELQELREIMYKFSIRAERNGENRILFLKNRIKVKRIKSIYEKNENKL